MDANQILPGDLDVRLSTLLLEGQTAAGEPVRLVGGGCEFWLDGVRKSRTGSCFFDLNIAGQSRDSYFPGLPLYTMVPEEEPGRIEIYMPPEAKVTNFPLVFEEDAARARRFVDEVGMRREVRFAAPRLSRELRFGTETFSILSGGMALLTIRGVSTAFEHGSAFAWDCATAENASRLSPRWAAFRVGERTGPGALLWGALHLEKGWQGAGYTLKGRRNETSISSGFERDQQRLHEGSIVVGTKRLVEVVMLSAAASRWLLFPAPIEAQAQSADGSFELRSGARLIHRVSFD